MTLAASRPRRATRHLAVTNAVLLLVALTVVFGGGEMLLRRGWIDPYGHYTTGMNPTLEWWKPAAPKTRRIVAVGDSFTGGPFSYPEQLQTALRTSSIRYEVLNLGVPGVGPRNYESRLSSVGRRFHPNIVLIGIYVGNDVANTRDPYDAPGWSNDLYYFLKDHSHLGRFIKLKADIAKREWDRWRHPPPPRPPYSATDPDPEPNPFLVEAAHDYPDFFTHALLLNHEGWRKALHETLGILREIHEDCGDMQATCVFVLFPAAVQVNARYQPFYRDIGFRLAPNVLTDPVVQREFVQFFQRERMAYLDLLPAFVRADAGDLYYPRDEHLTIRGREFTAERVLEELRARGLVAS